MCLETVPCFIPSRSASSTIKSPSPREISCKIRQRTGLPRPEASAANENPAGMAGADDESGVVLMEIPANLPETAANEKEISAQRSSFDETIIPTSDSCREIAVTATATTYFRHEIDATIKLPSDYITATSHSTTKTSASAAEMTSPAVQTRIGPQSWS